MKMDTVEEALFPPVDAELDLVKLEHEMLNFWSSQNVFKKFLTQNQSYQKKFSFIDGPITANNPMGLHHTWGRSLKDIIQRYWAMKGYAQRFQNGFDCQGLWIEVEVEKALGLNSKRAIEEYGLEQFSEKCKTRIRKFSAIITEDSKRLGQWMDWENSYFTHTDTNISYIWYFLKKCQEKGWLIKGHYPMPWCPRCGTSLSQHEQYDAYKQLTHTSVFVKFQLDQTPTTEPEFLLVWTTTPWTLAANTAVAVNPTNTYCKVKQGNETFYLAKEALHILKGNYQLLSKVQGEELLGKHYLTPFKALPAQKKVQHVVVDWTDISAEEGTGFVHIAPGCGAEDYELGKRHNLEVLSPVDEFGVFFKEYGFLARLDTKAASKRVIEELQRRALLYKKEEYTHRYPTCWRCHEELIFRLVDEWFIDSTEIRPLLKKAIEKVEWVPNYYGKRMLDWLNNMGNWCISRKRYWGLPLPFFECPECNTLTVVGSKEELLERAIAGTEKLEELHRPWIDNVVINCPKCNAQVPKVKEVGDCWLDAGIVPYSTLKYLTEPHYWKQWFPADAVCEMREQIRLWFYSLLFISVTLTGEPPYKRVIVHEKVHDKDGRPMHRSWGNAIWFKEVVERMGADVMRWAFAKQPLHQVMNFGFYLEKEVKKFFLTIWNTYSFFSSLATLDKFNPVKQRLPENYEPPLLDQWLLSSLNSLIKRVRENCDKAHFSQAIIDLETFVEKMSTWYLRRGKRRFWVSKMTQDKLSAYHTLYETLLTLTRLIAPFVPFFSEKLFQMLTANLRRYPESVHLSSYPKTNRRKINVELEEKMAVVLSVVKLGRMTRSKANLRLRQPLKEFFVWCKKKQHETILQEFKKVIQEELNVKKLTIAKKPLQMLKFTVKPNYPVLGPKLKGKIKALEEALTTIPQAEIQKAFYQGNQLLEISTSAQEPPLKLKLNEDLLVNVLSEDQHAIATNDFFAVALDTKLTEELLFEAYARDIIRVIQTMRKELNLQLNNKIRIKVATDDFLWKLLEQFKTHITTETLAKEITRAKTEEVTKRIKVAKRELGLAIEQL